jgi:hypothetical protein
MYIIWISLFKWVWHTNEKTLELLFFVEIHSYKYTRYLVCTGLCACGDWQPENHYCGSGMFGLGFISRIWIEHFSGSRIWKVLHTLHKPRMRYKLPSGVIDIACVVSDCASSVNDNAFIVYAVSLPPHAFFILFA